MATIDGVSCIKGEIHSILTAMRLSTRWSNVKNARTAYQDTENPFVNSFRKLNEYLAGLFDLSEVDCVRYLTPFYEVIVSDQASGPLTSVALSSVCKFAMFGFLSISYPRVKEGIDLVAKCISRCIFEETDWESDEVILMKLLELSTLTLRCESAKLLTVGAAWNIYSTCLSIHNQYRASKILRSEAETALRHLTQTAFSKAHSLLPNDDNNNNNTIDKSSTAQPLKVTNLNQSWDEVSILYEFDGYHGTTLFLWNIVTVLSNLMNTQNEPSNKVKFALSLINIALEAGGPTLSIMQPLVDVLKGDISRHLLRITQSDDLEMFSLALRVIFNLFMSIKNHMKVQLEVFLTSIHLRLLQNQQTTFIMLAKQELALESLLEFCREPSLMHDLYINYDCDVQCTNLFDSIINVLCERSQLNNPASTTIPTIHDSSTTVAAASTKDDASNNKFKPTILNRLAISGISTILHSISLKCDQLSSALHLVEAIQKHESSHGHTIIEDNDMDDIIGDEMMMMDGLPLTRQTTMTSTAADDINNATDITLEYNSNTITDMVGNTNTSGNTRHGQVISPLSNESDIVIVDHNSSAHTSYSRHQEISSTSTATATQSVPPVAREVSDSSHVSSVGNSAVSRNNSKDEYDKSSHSNMSQVPLNPNNSYKYDNASGTKKSKLTNPMKVVEDLRQRKLMKQRLLHAAELFNDKPLKLEWIRFALAQQLLLLPAGSLDSPIVDENKPADALSVAKFLKETPGLNKTAIGEYLSRGPADKYPFHADVLKEYVHTFDFKVNDASFVKALRSFLGYFRLPGEAQCIDRLMEAFAKKIYDDLGPRNPFASADAAFVLAFSTIMLQTDLHNPNVTTKRMSKEEFIRNNRGINDGENLPQEYLEALYDEIKSKKIEVDVDVGDSSNDLLSHVNLTDTVSWNKLIKRGDKCQAPATFTPTVVARRSTQVLDISGINSSISWHQKDMFLSMEERLCNTILSLWQTCEDDSVLTRTFHMLWDYTRICIDLDLTTIFNELIQRVLEKSIDIITTSRKLLTRDAISNKTIINQFYQKLWSLEVQYGKHDLLHLLKSSMEDLIITPNKQLEKGENDEDLYNWIGCRLIKGELALKYVTYIMCKYYTLLEKRSWIYLVSLLVWLRSRGSLPMSLATLSHTWSYQPTIHHTPISIDLARYQPSLFSIMCIRSSKGLTTQESNNSPVRSHQPVSTSLLGAVASVFFSPSKSNVNTDTAGNQSKYDEMDISIDYQKFDLNSSLYMTSIGPDIDKNISIDKLLSLGLADTSFQFIFQETANIQNNSGKGVDSVLIFIDLFYVLLQSLIHQSTDIILDSSLDSTMTKKTKSLQEDSTKSISDSSNEEMVTIIRTFPLEVTEMDLLFVLEIIQRWLNLNMKQLYVVWNKLYGIFKFIFEQNLEQACIKCPFVIERVSLLILRCSLEIIPIIPMDTLTTIENSKNITLNGILLDISRIQHYASCFTTSNLSLSPYSINTRVCEDMWHALRYIKTLPLEFLDIISGSLSYMLLFFIRPSPQYMRNINTVEEWYLFFNLLSMITSNKETRSNVWSIVFYIIDSHMVTSNNFSPLRHLLLKFLFGIFNDKDKNFSSPDTQDMNWQLPSMWCLVLLTNMALGGYIHDYASSYYKEISRQRTLKSFTMKPSTNTTDIATTTLADFLSNTSPTSSSSSSSSTTMTSTKWMSLLDILVTFPLPSGTHFKQNIDVFKHTKTINQKMSVHSPRLTKSNSSSNNNNYSRQIDPQATPFNTIPSTTTTTTTTVSSSSVEKTSSSSNILNSNEITTIRVHFKRAVEIELLWLEHCKTFADFSNSTDFHVSQYAMYCLEVILLSGSLSGFDKAIYINTINEMLLRLPISLVVANERLQRLESPNLVQLVYDYSMSGCRVIFRALIQLFDLIYDDDDFLHIWKEYISILATNANMLLRGSNVHNDLIDIIAALLQLLKIPTRYQSGHSSMTSTLTSTQPNTVVQTQPTAKSVPNTSVERTSPQKSSVTVPNTSSGNGGWLTWFTGVSPPPTEEPIVTNSSVAATTTTTTTSPNDSANAITTGTNFDSKTETVAVNTLTPSKDIGLSTVDVHDKIDDIPSSSTNLLTESMDHIHIITKTAVDHRNNEYQQQVRYDQLLQLTWMTITALYPSFSSHLRIKYPQLVNTIQQYLEFLNNLDRNKTMSNDESLPLSTTTPPPSAHGFSQDSTENNSNNNNNNNLQAIKSLNDPTQPPTMTPVTSSTNTLVTPTKSDPNNSISPSTSQIQVV